MKPGDIVVLSSTLTCRRLYDLYDKKQRTFRWEGDIEINSSDIGIVIEHVSFPIGGGEVNEYVQLYTSRGIRGWTKCTDVNGLPILKVL